MSTYRDSKERDKTYTALALATLLTSCARLSNLLLLSLSTSILQLGAMSLLAGSGGTTQLLALVLDTGDKLDDSWVLAANNSVSTSRRLMITVLDAVENVVEDLVLGDLSQSRRKGLLTTVENVRSQPR